MWKSYLPQLKYDSLFRRLLIRTLITLFIVLLVAAIQNFLAVYSEVREVFDREMAQTTRIYEALLSVYIRQVDIANTDVDQLYRVWKKSYESRALDPGGNRYRNFGRGVDFQLLSKDGRVLLKSAGAPAKPFIKKLAGGFYDVPSYKQHAGGRLFCYYNPDTKHWLLMVRSLDQRNEILVSVIMRTIQIMLVAFALLLIFLPRVLAGGMRSLRQLQQELADRGPKNMAPVMLDNPPQELQQINGALSEMMRRVQAGVERESRFVAEAAHELRTPLTILRLHSQQLEGQNLSKDAQASLQQLQHGIQRSRRLVEQLLALSRAEGGNNGNDFEQIELQPLLREIVADMVPLALLRRQVLELEGDDGLIINGNREQLRILCSNLIDNALRYSPDCGHVLVETKRERDQIVIRVLDDGPGLKPEERSRVFDRFWRGETGRGDGAGLGMAIVSSLVKRHKGMIQLENRLEGGLEARVVLPEK
ncbi:sensor histidine kinase [Spongorhabdus nitratireducens]